jgi:serine O-acetyltransferase
MSPSRENVSFGNASSASPYQDRREAEEARQISHETPDWTRERKLWNEWAPSRSLLASIRGYQRIAITRRPWTPLARWILVLRHRWWSIVTGADVPVNCQIGGGLRIPHPNGIVIHPDAVIGPNCHIFQQVTIGLLDDSGAPRIGGHVDIGAGAKILGRVTIGHHAKIGANAVVLSDVPEGATAVGIPARVISPSTCGDISERASGG